MYIRTSTVRDERDRSSLEIPKSSDYTEYCNLKHMIIISYVVWCTHCVSTYYRVARSRLTFQMVIDNIWNRKKFAKPSINTSKYAIYYPQITSLFSENYIRWMASVYINALLQACLEVAYTRLCRSSSIAATSSTVACLSSWIVMIATGTHGLTGTPTGKSLVQWGRATEQAKRCRRNER